MDLIINCACSLELTYCLSRNICQENKNLRCLKEVLIYFYVSLCQTTTPHILEQHLRVIRIKGASADQRNNLNGAQVLGGTIRVDHVAKYIKKEEEMRRRRSVKERNVEFVVLPK
nr:hypothetical protein [Tanacetum cinerariifolium]